ncbi:MAG TPA: hypothetical protein VFN36_05820 [Solirubrobacteraceae bacterium]|nr:hypothetical protein [Solirubrobacteraceae bacterium]
MQPHHRSGAGAAATLLAVLLGLTTALLLAMPPAATAAPRHDRGLTIAATPDPISAGAGVLIYGRLSGPHSAFRRVSLLHRIAPAQRFTPVSVTRTNAAGFYEFIRADGVVTSNRSWFVLGPRDTHSRTIHEWVSSVVTLDTAPAATTTAQTVSFSGAVSPNHPHQRVLLQEQMNANGTGWRTFAAGSTDANSAFTIPHRFRQAGTYTLRAVFPNDPRNIAGQSASVSLTVQQEQNPSFTIGASAPAVLNGQPETISGTLYADGSTTVPQPNVTVTLYGRPGTGPLRALQSTQTDSSGAYSFTTTPLHNTVYVVRAGHQERTARLYVGVQDLVSAALSAPTVAVGDAVRVTGTVTPAHNGHVVYLQLQGPGGHWVDIEQRRLSAASTFAFSYMPGMPGSLDLRVQITGGPWNVGGASAILPLTISGAAPIASLPAAS